MAWQVGQAYDVMVGAEGVAPRAASALEAVTSAYADEKTDEFVPATVVGDYGGMKDGDGGSGTTTSY